MNFSSCQRELIHSPDLVQGPWVCHVLYCTVKCKCKPHLLLTAEVPWMSCYTCGRRLRRRSCRSRHTAGPGWCRTCPCCRSRACRRLQIGQRQSTPRSPRWRPRTAGQSWSHTAGPLPGPWPHRALADRDRNTPCHTMDSAVVLNSRRYLKYILPNIKWAIWLLWFGD